MKKTPTNTYRPEAVTDDSGLETNLGEITKIICSKPPKAPCSIQLMLDHESQDEDVEFEILREFTMSAMKYLFGEQANPCTLSEADFERLNCYVKSVGYMLNVDKEETEHAFRFKISFEPYRSVKSNPYDHLKKYMGEPRPPM